MIRLAVSVEGQTEEEFVKRVLDEHLRPLGVAPEPILIGGSVTVRRLASDMALLYHSHDSVTSLVDYYGFQRKGDRSVEALEAHLREKTGERVGAGWDENRVFPYVQMHEFEGLLFSMSRSLRLKSTSRQTVWQRCGLCVNSSRPQRTSTTITKRLRAGASQV